eukprot:11059012-Karenia_brevis.AAC.1
MEDNSLEDVWVAENHLEARSHDYRPQASEGAYWDNYPPARNHLWPLIFDEEEQAHIYEAVNRLRRWMILVQGHSTTHWLDVLGPHLTTGIIPGR